MGRVIPEKVKFLGHGQSHKKNQGEYLQGCRLRAVPIKLDDVHSSLTALGGNGSISTSLWVTFLLCWIYIYKCLKSSHLPGVLWLFYNCQSWEKATFRLASPPAGSSPKTMSSQSQNKNALKENKCCCFFSLKKKLLNCLQKSDSDLQKKKKTYF